MKGSAPWQKDTETRSSFKRARATSGIAHSIIEACQELRAEPGYTGTAQITSDLAVKLMVHELAFICRLHEIEYSADAWGEAMDAACAKEGRGRHEHRMRLVLPELRRASGGRL